MKLIRWLDRNLEESVMIVLIATICVVMFVQVISRYFFHHAFPWAEELCRFLFVWFACMGFATGVKHHEDLRVDSIYDRATKKMKIVMDVITTVCMFAFCLTLGYGSFSILRQQVQLGTLSSSLKLPMVVVYASLAFGLLFMLLRMIQNLVRKQRL